MSELPADWVGNQDERGQWEPFGGANEAARLPHEFEPWGIAPSLCAHCGLYPEARCHEIKDG